ncbi:MAG: DUF1501 domain-containing protein [Planctomycetes bacterium]|nr:DUF1501 domain-containing protein [Planctomycetota bacterium]
MNDFRFSRRDLLRIAAASAVAAMIPGSLSAADPEVTPGPEFDWKRALVLIELRGGNDGLNTVIPWTDPLYAKYRPRLAIPGDQIVKADAYGLHPSLAALGQGWKDQDMAVVLGLGYPNPNRSHFRSIDIWNAATKADELGTEGWIARVFAKSTSRPDAGLLADGVVWGYSDTVGHGGQGPLFGNDMRLLVMNSPEEFVQRARGVKAAPSVEHSTKALEHVLAVRRDIASTVDRLAQIQGKAPQIKTPFPDSGLGNHLKMTARLIAAGAAVPVWKLSIDGFDTHAGQRDNHARLLKTVGDAIAAFRLAMQEIGQWDQVVVATYSEFGRRVEENASGGTDHGTSAPHFVLGGKVRGGYHGTYPALDKLEHGDLPFSTDYRRLYASFAEEWWGFKQPFMSQKSHKPLGLFRV